MTRFTLTPNCSLTANGLVLFYVGIASVSLIIAFGFVLMGYWPVLPFAGLELALLGWALRHSWLRGQSHEEINITAQTITLISRDADGNETRRRELPTTWTRIELIRGTGIAEELAFGREGRWWVVGRFLIDQEKRALRHRIAQVLRQVHNSASDARVDCEPGRESR
ncbi:MAG: DUF2244 domain-containing protein [Pseudomonadota bacterium]